MRLKLRRVRGFPPARRSKSWPGAAWIAAEHRPSAESPQVLARGVAIARMPRVDDPAPGPPQGVAALPPSDRVDAALGGVETTITATSWRSARSASLATWPGRTTSIGAMISPP